MRIILNAWIDDKKSSKGELIEGSDDYFEMPNDMPLPHNRDEMHGPLWGDGVVIIRNEFYPYGRETSNSYENSDLPHVLIVGKYAS